MVTIINVVSWDIGEKITEGIKGAVVDVSKWVALGIIDNSYIICLGVAMVGLILYLGGWKKGAKLTTVSMVVFFLLQCIGGAIR